MNGISDGGDGGDGDRIDGAAAGIGRRGGISGVGSNVVGGGGSGSSSGLNGDGERHDSVGNGHGDTEKVTAGRVAGGVYGVGAGGSGAAAAVEAVAGNAAVTAVEAAAAAEVAAAEMKQVASCWVFCRSSYQNTPTLLLELVHNKRRRRSWCRLRLGGVVPLALYIHICVYVEFI